MDPVLLLVLGGIGIALAGIAIGVVIGRVTGRARKAAELETELEQTKEAFEEYRGEVVQQFADTAGKFRRLNESYSDLHQQLATSASVLCADRAGDVLLALPGSDGVPAETPAAADDSATIDGDSEAVQGDVPPSAEPIDATVDAETAVVDEIVEPDLADPVAEVDLPVDEPSPADSEVAPEAGSSDEKRTA